jgi:hypothetical protein
VDEGEGGVGATVGEGHGGMGGRDLRRWGSDGGICVGMWPGGPRLGRQGMRAQARIRTDG